MKLDKLKKEVLEYCKRNPDELFVMGKLLSAIHKGGEGLFDRKSMAGHCTSSMLVLSSDHEQALLIHHKVYGTWIPPGGHFEADSASLYESAVRELREETGLTEFNGLLWDDFLLDIDTHAIPERREKGEGAHWHYDFMYVAEAPRDFQLVPQESEVKGVEWRSLSDLAQDSIERNRRLVHKLKLLGQLP